MWINDVPLLVSPTEENPLDAEPLDQVVLRDKDGNFGHVQIFPNMKPERLSSDIAKIGISDPDSVHVHCDHSRSGYFNDLLSQMFPRMKHQDLEDLQPGSRRVRGRAEFRLGIGYFQAMAKTALHYYLLNNRRGFTGHESIFDDIKKFIRHGGEVASFFQSQGREFPIPFKNNDGEGGTYPANEWLHLLLADDERDWIVVCLRPYIGPGSLPDPIFVTLASLSGRAAIPKAASKWGHAFSLQIATASTQPGHVRFLSNAFKN